MTTKLDAKIWGPHYWFFIDTIAMSYPIKANDVIKKKYYELIQNMRLFIPDYEMGNEFGNLIDKYPVTPYLDKREDFVKWVHFLHNKMNEKLEKPQITLEEFYRRYYELYKPKDQQMREYIRTRSKFVYFGLLVLLGGGIYYFYDK
jgi:hypothetical protein